jgi:hypothetical protein
MTLRSIENYIKPGAPKHAGRQRSFRKLAFDNFTYLVTYLSRYLPDDKAAMSESNPPPTDALTAATQMVKKGRLDQARETLMPYLMKNPSSEQAWLLMSYVLSDPAKQKDCLERVLKINPNNTVAQSKLARLLGRRTEELFNKRVVASQPPASEYEPVSELEPGSEPKPEPEPLTPPETKAAAVPPPEPLGPVEKPVFERTPAPRSKPVKPAPVEPVFTTDRIPPPERKSPFSGKWFRIITIALVALIMVLAAVIIYFGVLGPALNTIFASPTPTVAPISTVDLPLPPQWTQTLTPTQSPVPPATKTPTLTPDFTPFETTIS